MKIFLKIFINVCLLTFLFCTVLSQECIPKDYGNGGTVCVCNADHCDTVSPVTLKEVGTFIQYISSKSGLRFKKTEGTFGTQIRSEYGININSDIKYQTINGWGGAFTDSAGINMNSLNNQAKEKLLRSYFSKDGLEYSLCRVPIGGTDFSTRAYSYDDNMNDVDLKYFNLTQEDYNIRIPLIKQASNLTDNKLKLFASAWSAPAWMKTNNAFSGIGFLRENMYQTWANYHLKFFESYENQGIHFWGMTTGNEPSNGYLPFVKINSMGWTPKSQSKWISENLGPTIRSSKFSNLKIMVLDDQRFFLPWWINSLLKDESTRNFIDGIAVHWYYDEYIPAILLNMTHNNFPDKFLLGTEACVGDKPFQTKVDLGSWHRGQMYADDIIKDMQNWVTGWVDWNLALDTTGGPTYINNLVDSPIIVNATAQEFYKQPMYYTLGHFAKFIPPTSVRIHVDNYQWIYNLEVVALKRPDNGTVVVILNKHGSDFDIIINDSERGRMKTVIEKYSISTILYL